MGKGPHGRLRYSGHDEGAEAFSACQKGMARGRAVVALLEVVLASRAATVSRVAPSTSTRNASRREDRRSLVFYTCPDFLMRLPENSSHLVNIQLRKESRMVASGSKDQLP